MNLSLILNTSGWPYPSKEQMHKIGNYHTTHAHLTVIQKHGSKKIDYLTQDATMENCIVQYIRHNHQNAYSLGSGYLTGHGYLPTLVI